MDDRREEGDRVFHALIGDMVGSREIEGRGDVQRRLIEILRALNDSLGSAVAVPLRLTSGDELQGLFVAPGAVVDVLSRIADELHPVTFAWGVGVGGISTELTDDIAMVDGPCLHRARRALEGAQRAGNWIGVEGLPALEGEVLSALLNLIGALRSEWTETEGRYAREARGRSQREVAEDFGVHDSTVSRALARAHFRTVLAGEEAARILLEAVAPEEAEEDRA